MNASAKRTIRLGLTVGLSLGAIVGIVGCSEQMDDANADNNAAVESDNGFSLNGYSINGFSQNGFSVNGFSANGFSANGFSANGFSLNGMSMNGMSANGFSVNGMSMNGMSINGLTLTNGLAASSKLLKTAGGREALKYMVKVAFRSGQHLTKQDDAVPPNTYDFEGSIGAAPELADGLCDLACQEKISAGMLAHVNNAGVHVGIWLVGPDAGYGWGSSPDYPFMEAAYFGNLFVDQWRGNYCAGEDLGAGDAKGRLGSPFGNNSSILSAAYGTGAYGLPVPCVQPGNAYCTAQNEGYSTCKDLSATAPYTNPHTWSHPVTVYRNFESTQLYKICNKASTNLCLGVVGGSTSDGAGIEARNFTGASGQTWQILQVAPGYYQIVNKTSGKVMDISGSTVNYNGVNSTYLVQRGYTGAATQKMPITYIANSPGLATLVFSSNTGSAMRGYNGMFDGARIINGAQTGGSAADSEKWTFTAISLANFDPGRIVRLVPQSATGSSIDVCNGQANAGNCVQQYATWGTDGQRFYLKAQDNGNVKLALKSAPNMCIGPVGNVTNLNTQMTVVDCATSGYASSWISSEQGAGSNVFVFRNAANPTMCLDIPGSNPANGVRPALYYCNGGANQKFQSQNQ